MKLNKNITYQVGSDRTTKKMRSYVLAKHELEKSGQIYVRVSYGRDIYNDGTFESFASFKRALDGWTEPILIDYVKGGAW